MRRIGLALLLVAGLAAALHAQDLGAPAALDHFVVVGRAGYSDTPAFLQFIRDAEQGIQTKSTLAQRGPLAIVVLVLLGGFALNLTPCVLPMIPINLAIIGAGARARSRTSGFLLGGAYGMAMAATYGVLGAVVILTAGRFGTLNASPWFNIALAGVFVTLGLAMLDVVTIDLSRLSSGRVGGSSGAYVLAVTMGVLAALLAGACVAPVVIEVVLFASQLYAGGTKIALALPLCLGIGMAAPWPLAGGGLASLPRPGRWMLQVKRAFAAFILATAAYYAYEGYTIISIRAGAAPAAASARGWTTSLEAGLAEARRDRKPVLIDMWATWCRDCLAMDRTTLADPAVIDALSGFVKIKYSSEVPDEPPVSDVLDRLGVVGFPAYVIMRPID